MQDDPRDENLKPIDLAEGLYRGQFGFRNRGNRTGVDPWDTQMEEAHAEGLFWRALLTLRLRTRNPAALVLMIFGALVLLMPVEFSIAEMLAGVSARRLSFAPLFEATQYVMGQVECIGALMVMTLVGVLLAINIGLSFKDMLSRKRD